MSLENKYSIWNHLALMAHGPPAAGLAAAAAVAASDASHKRSDMTWKDHLVMLLHTGAEIEHSLMVQYLYAAYSLGGDKVLAKHRPMVQRWQEEILAVAREEMGHLLTVQNVLTLIGGPINLARVNLPWDIPFYPFPFQLEPVTLESIACYVYAEMPSDEEFEDARKRSPGGKLLDRYQRFVDRDRKAIQDIANSRAHKRGAHRVGGLYQEIIKLLADNARIPDSVFHDNTFTFQASFDDWGRGYRPRPQMLDAEGSLLPRVEPAAAFRQAHVMVDRVATRSQAVAALKALSEQGEAPVLATKETDEYSHFDRFLEIYQAFDDNKSDCRPSRAVPTNPATLQDPDSPNDGYISAKHSQQWASLFNLRYRMLLKYLAHTFRLARTIAGDTPNLRAMVMHRVFAEMYNLKTIAGILVALPRHDGKDDGLCAGPPFEMPYTLDLPQGELERWILHRDLLRSSLRICHGLHAHREAKEHGYLSTLIDLDGKTDAWVGCILAGLATERTTA
jgi:Ferritin-like